jgi:peroxiredoxin
MGNERTTFVIDPAGNITMVLRKVKPSEHDELVLKGLKEVASHEPGGLMLRA